MPADRLGQREITSPVLLSALLDKDQWPIIKRIGNRLRVHALALIAGWRQPRQLSLILPFRNSWVRTDWHAARDQQREWRHYHQLFYYFHKVILLWKVRLK